MRKNGGRKLRELRQARGETIENIATDAGVTFKALSELETGKTKSPSRETIQKIIQALEQISPVSAEDQRYVYEAFGYKKPNPLPIKIEVERAIHQWREDYDYIPYPAYLVDCG